MYKKIIGIVVVAISLFIISINFAATSKPASPVSKGSITKEIALKNEVMNFTIVTAASKIRFQGKSTLHNFNGFTDQLKGYIKGSPKKIEKAECRITIPVKTLHTDKTELNENLWEDIEEQKYPEIVFKLTNVKVLKVDYKANFGEVVATGEVTAHGITKNVSVPLKMELENGFIKFTGKCVFNMADYNIKPRSFMKFIKVNKLVSIEIEVYSDLIKGPA